MNIKLVFFLVRVGKGKRTRTRTRSSQLIEILLTAQGRYVIGIQKKKDEVCLPTKVIILPKIPRKAWDQF